MKKTIFFLTLALIVCTHHSCKKDETPTKKELITGNTWIIVSKAINPPAVMGGITIDDVIILDSEDQRNYSYKFNADGSMIQYNQAGQEIFQTTWTLSTDETLITYNPGIIYSYSVAGDVVLNTMTIESISENKMVAKLDYVFAGVAYLATFTYEPK